MTERQRGWINPLTVAVAAAAIAGFSNLWLASENNRAALALERNRAESGRILEMLKAGDPARVRENLRFLLQVGLVQDEELRRRIEAWEANPDRSPLYLSTDEGPTGRGIEGEGPTARRVEDDGPRQTGGGRAAEPRRRPGGY